MSDELARLSDTPNEPEARPPDLITRARIVARAVQGDMTLIAAYRSPDYVRWGVEALSEEDAVGVVLGPRITD